MDLEDSIFIAKNLRISSKAYDVMLSYPRQSMSISESSAIKLACLQIGYLPVILCTSWKLLYALLC